MNTMLKTSNWLQKLSTSDKLRIENNIARLEDLKTKIHDLGYFAIASQSGAYQLLKELLEEPVVKGRERVFQKLQSALVGPNNSKLVLDAPTKFQGLMNDTEQLIKTEINKEIRKLKELESSMEK